MIYTVVLTIKTGSQHGRVKDGSISVHISYQEATSKEEAIGLAHKYLEENAKYMMMINDEVVIGSAASLIPNEYCPVNN